MKLHTWRLRTRAPLHPRLVVGRLICRIRDHTPDSPRMHQLAVGGNTTHRYEVIRCRRCNRLLHAGRINRKRARDIVRVDLLQRP